VLSIAGTFIVGQTFSAVIPTKVNAAIPVIDRSEESFKTSKNWKGTSLNLLSPLGAISYLNENNAKEFPMGRWPDPILRVPSLPTSTNLMNTPTLQTVAEALRQTSISNKAVGLAAQQCGIQISLIYLDIPQKKFARNTNNNDRGMFLVNPRFISRSPESKMKVWEEECLVLPPDFHATVLRDAEVLVEAEDLSGNTFRMNLTGEEARAIQHESDHDRGILITDHVGKGEMRNENMWMIEKDGHFDRQQRAFDRYLGMPGDSILSKKTHIDDFGSNNVLSLDAISETKQKETGPKVVCDDDCKQRIKERRALSKQSRSTSSRQEVFELSKQRALLYNTTYKGSSCISGLPCY